MTGTDHYRTLGVDRKATARTISKAYKRLARKFHPDVNPGDKAAEERFKSISEAYGVLSDPGKRQEYDAYGGHSGAGPRWSSAGTTGEAGFGGLGDIFAQMFNQSGVRAGGTRGPARGGHIEAALRISFMDAVRGVTAPVRSQRQATCSSCSGSGTRPGSRAEACGTCSGTGQWGGGRRVIFAGQMACQACAGTGRVQPRNCRDCGGQGSVRKTETIEVKVPAGVADGTRLRVAGHGHAGSGGGPAGDLHVRVRVDAHPVFSRKADNIFCTVPVTITEAALGARIEVPTVDGAARLTIPPGTSSGQQFRLRGKGMASARGPRGDQIVQVQVLTPPNDNEKTRRLLEELAESLPAAPRAEILRQGGS